MGAAEGRTMLLLVGRTRPPAGHLGEHDSCLAAMLLLLRASAAQRLKKSDLGYPASGVGDLKVTRGDNRVTSWAHRLQQQQRHFQRYLISMFHSSCTGAFGRTQASAQTAWMHGQGATYVWPYASQCKNAKGSSRHPSLHCMHSTCMQEPDTCT